MVVELLKLLGGNCERGARLGYLPGQIPGHADQIEAVGAAPLVVKRVEFLKGFLMQRQTLAEVKLIGQDVPQTVER
ncbi:MAG: hypothetical protein HY682_10575 [Chloroflexi bacterium]|nr:hypothetical protein [Chloroflexota bacterium]